MSARGLTSSAQGISCTPCCATTLQMMSAQCFQGLPCTQSCRQHLHGVLKACQAHSLADNACTASSKPDMHTVLQTIPAQCLQSWSCTQCSAQRPADDISKTFTGEDDRKLFESLTFSVVSGDKLAIVGPNGGYLNPDGWVLDCVGELGQMVYV
jgi:hypothetical protein